MITPKTKWNTKHYKSKWDSQPLYGGKLANYLVQARAADEKLSSIVSTLAEDEKRILGIK